MKNALFFPAWFIAALLCGAFPAQADTAPLKISVSVPGPRNISYLPIDLISKIGADKWAGKRD